MLAALLRRGTPRIQKRLHLLPGLDVGQRLMRTGMHGSLVEDLADVVRIPQDLDSSELVVSDCLGHRRVRHQSTVPASLKNPPVGPSSNRVAR